MIIYTNIHSSCPTQVLSFNLDWRLNKEKEEIYNPFDSNQIPDGMFPLIQIEFMIVFLVPCTWHHRFLQGFGMDFLLISNILSSSSPLRIRKKHPPNLKH
mmetsp:Transcript_19667/g.21117  ORF Transcript_19667/g.21117 Transcript_19667/m.21117 type:complete len:100 (-) Transcript_19667:550-849(-)